MWQLPHLWWIGTRPYNGVVYFNHEIKQFIFLMFMLWVRYWFIYAVQSMCLPGLVNICVCLFNQNWLGTPGLEYSIFFWKTLRFIADVFIKKSQDFSNMKESAMLIPHMHACYSCITVTVHSHWFVVLKFYFDNIRRHFFHMISTLSRVWLNL